MTWSFVFESQFYHWVFCSITRVKNLQESLRGGEYGKGEGMGDYSKQNLQAPRMQLSRGNVAFLPKKIAQIWVFSKMVYFNL